LLSGIHESTKAIKRNTKQQDNKTTKPQNNKTKRQQNENYPIPHSLLRRHDGKGRSIRFRS